VYFSGLVVDALHGMFARESLIFLIVFATGVMLLVFLGIVCMTSVWVKSAERLRRDGKLRRARLPRRQIIQEI
jgi:polyferredoxin